MKTKDDFNWTSYPTHYEGEINDNLNRHKLDMIVTDFKISDGNLIINDKLHPNWKEIYSLIFNLKVKSVYECGCGSGHHLINLNTINPKLKINGSDYSKSQLDLGEKYWDLGNYEFAKNLKVVDMTNVEDIDSLGKHEFVYTQAVTMHLMHDKAKKFLYNMKELSSKYVYLVENGSAHNYDELISEIFPEFERIDNKLGFLLKRK